MSNVYIGLILYCFITLSLQFNCTNQYKPVHYFVDKYGSAGAQSLIESLVELKTLKSFERECILSRTNLEKVETLNEQNLNKICPHILEFIDSIIITNSTEVNIIEDKPSYVWQYGLLSVTIISLCSLIGIAILPLMKKSFYNKVLMYLICLAVGTLSCNALFQLLPEGFNIDSDPMTVWRSAVMFLGCYAFYLIDNLLEILFNTSDNLDYEESSDISVETELTQDSTSATSSSKNDLISHGNWKPNESEELIVLNPPEHNIKTSKSNSCWMFNNCKSIKAVAWMITIADGMHNFIDGLAIGASFSTSTVQGVSTSVAIFCEEFPHELGDFAILLSAGMSLKQAAFFNFASACCCYVGLFFGILVGHDMQTARWIFSLAGGVFLYISLAGMLPEARNIAKKQDLRNRKWLCFYVQNFGLLSGFVIMFVLTLYNDKIQF